MHTKVFTTTRHRPGPKSTLRSLIAPEIAARPDPGKLASLFAERYSYCIQKDQPPQQVVHETLFGAFGTRAP